MHISFLESVIPIDLLQIIKSFLTNKEIIELICTSKTFILNFKSHHLFSTITISIKEWFQGLKRYIKHYKTIKTVKFLGFDENDIKDLWPFDYLNYNLLQLVPLCKKNKLCKDNSCLCFHMHENITTYKKRKELAYKP